MFEGHINIFKVINTKTIMGRTILEGGDEQEVSNLSQISLMWIGCPDFLMLKIENVLSLQNFIFKSGVPGDLHPE